MIKKSQGYVFVKRAGNLNTGTIHVKSVMILKMFIVETLAVTALRQFCTENTQKRLWFISAPKFRL